MTFLRNFWKDEQGQDLIEYTLLMAFVALASAALFLGAGGSIKGIWSRPITNWHKPIRWRANPGLGHADVSRDGMPRRGFWGIFAVRRRCPCQLNNQPHEAAACRDPGGSGNALRLHNPPRQAAGIHWQAGVKSE